MFSKTPSKKHCIIKSVNPSIELYYIQIKKKKDSVNVPYVVLIFKIII